ncbi:unnamed protein product [marine sediment metagenome]|uniref:Uncharacterized protein n=1 Tax=marine sediment metagenome TaxID=412755 RepID=X1U930_9ZZZZ
MAKLLAEEVSLIDVAEIAGDAAHRTATTPFGAPPGKGVRYVGRSVPWKFNFAAAPAAVRAGLDKAIGISRGCAGVRGIAINPITHETVPAKVICQLRAAGKVRA